MPSFTVRTNCEFSLSIVADSADAAIAQAQDVAYADRSRAGVDAAPLGCVRRAEKDSTRCPNTA